MVAGGREAIAELEANDFDFAILDLMMPYVDGYQVLTWIRSNERTVGMKVAMLVGDPEAWLSVTEAEHRADFYWKKSDFGV